MLVSPEGLTWEREIKGRWKRTTIDLVFHRRVHWEPVRGTKLSADHWRIGVSLDTGTMDESKKTR